SAQEAWKRADALAAGSRGLLSRELRDRLETLAAQLKTDEQERQLAFALDKIRLESANPVEGQLQLARAAPKVSQALAAGGYEIEWGGQDPTEIADRIRRSAIRLPLLGALDFWAGATRDVALRARVLDIACRSDA